MSTRYPIRLCVACCLMLMLLAMPPVASAADAPAAPSSSKLVIVNMAADGVVNYVLHALAKQAPLGNGATREMALAALDKEVDQYEGTGVTHLFWNVNYQRVGYRSAVWPGYWDAADPQKEITEWPRSYYHLHKLGIDDVFGRLIPRCRERKISPWVSLRMNDHHYLGDPTRVSPLMFDHPEMRIHKGKGLFNYAKPEVRQHYLKLVAEVLERYDIDGLELDWIRTPSNFEDNEIDQGREILNEFVRSVRERTQAAAKRLGHPVRLAVRVPARPEFAFGKGLDAIFWARQGLVDMIVASDWWSGYNDTPIEAWRQQINGASGAGSGGVADAGQRVQIVPCTASTYACTAKGYSMSRNLAGLRGFAASMYDRGADGIYFFNHFDSAEGFVRMRAPDGASIDECRVGDLFRSASSLGDPAEAAKGPRLHALAIHDCVPAKADYRPALPAILAPPQSPGSAPATQPAPRPGAKQPQPQPQHAFKIHIGPRPVAGACLIRIGLDGAAPEALAAAKLDVRVNAQACRALADLPRPAKPDPRPQEPRRHICEVAPRVLQFEAPLAALERGYNTVQISLLESPSPQTITWLEIGIER